MRQTWNFWMDACALFAFACCRFFIYFKLRPTTEMKQKHCLRRSFGYNFVNLITTICHLSMESCLPISVIVYGAHVTVGFDQRILSLHNIAVTFFFLVFNVAGVWIVDAIFECISWMIVLEMDGKKS